MSSKKLSAIQTVLQLLGLFVLIFIVSWGFINAPALFAKIDYWLGNYKNADQVLEINNQGQLPIASQRKNLQNNRLYIPKIGVNAKISWNVEFADQQEKLRQSVIHIKETARPGQKGNVFITGHSSYYWWIGKYTRIFALLPQLEKGDKIAITYKNKIYTYKVYDRVVVSAAQTEVMDQGNNKELSLMTCVPIGTNFNRLVIKAKQIKVSSK